MASASPSSWTLSINNERGRSFLTSLPKWTASRGDSCAADYVLACKFLHIQPHPRMLFATQDSTTQVLAASLSHWTLDIGTVAALLVLSPLYPELQVLRLRRAGLTAESLGALKLLLELGQVKALFLDDDLQTVPRDDVLDFVSSAAPSLQLLSLSNCALDDASLASIVETCSGLVSLVLDGNCVGATTVEALSSLLLTNPPRLKHLSLAHCQILDMSLMQQLLDALRSIEISKDEFKAMKKDKKNKLPMRSEHGKCFRDGNTVLRVLNVSGNVSIAVTGVTSPSCKVYC